MTSASSSKTRTPSPKGRTPQGRANASDRELAAKASRARGRKSQAVAAQQILSSVLTRYGLEEKVSEYRFVAEWPDIVGAELAKRSRPEGISRGVLTVKVVGSAWAQEFSFFQDIVLGRVRARLDNPESLRSIRFVVDSNLVPLSVAK